MLSLMNNSQLFTGLVTSFASPFVLDMPKEKYEEWLSIEEDIPETATLTDLEIYQAACEQDQAIKSDDSEGDDCIEESPPTNAKMMQAFDILKTGVQH
ncbi:hypothetical protein AVEN_223521-1 [Araneus ventricosus]|uniref:Uncharacterized protein n=1 Tax=Araneus ventricosus TaxID=182803 RepID=A0A4Y2P9G3_ARAVE|nr:hypothetical protein AVEN_223521-1 [Araneus ventricosus]